MTGYLVTDISTTTTIILAFYHLLLAVMTIISRIRLKSSHYTAMGQDQLPGLAKLIGWRVTGSNYCSNARTVIILKV